MARIPVIAPTNEAVVIDQQKFFDTAGHTSEVVFTAYNLQPGEEIVPYAGGSGSWVPIYEDGNQVIITSLRPQIYLATGIHYGFTKSATVEPVGLDAAFGDSDSETSQGEQGPRGVQGPEGPQGLSAFEVAQVNGFTGNETEWLESLHGADGEDGVGSPGLSAYEVAVANGFVGDEAAWLASLEGADGADGAPGASAYDIAVANGFVGDEAAWLASLEGTDGTNGTNGTNGADGAAGASAYEVAVANGFVGDEAAWLASLIGADGLSAYEVAVANGFVGDVTAWLASLVGPAGADGTDGTNGTNGTNGVDGRTILNGAGAPAAGLGANGDFYINTNVPSIYGPKTASGWGTGVSLVGPEGPPGAGGETLGEEILPAFGASWSTTGTTPPTVDASGAHFSGATNFASARFVTTAIQPSTEYEVTYTVANYVSGDVSAVLCSSSADFGAIGTLNAANGTYTERLTTNATTGLGDQIRIRSVGPNGTFDITSFSVKEVITGASGGDDSYTAIGVGAATRTKNEKLQEVVSIEDFLLPAHGSNYSPALEAAMAAHDVIYFPPGNYTFNTAVALPDDKTLYGACGRDGVQITANNGFLYNTSATVRKSIFLSNMTVNGNGSAIAISGPFGGRIENVAFDGFTKCIENAFGFLIQFQRCSFRDAAYGIHIAVSNGVVVNDCFFAADCPIAFDTVTLPASDVSGGGYTGSLPMIFSNNNVNQGNAGGTGVTSCRFSGLFVGFGNYFEDYSTVVTGNVFVEYEVHRFAGGSFRWHTNEMNGQGNGIHAVRLVGSASQACDANGEITGNRFIGFTSSPIRCGDSAGANNYIRKLRVFDNNNDAISNQNARGIYKPMVDMGFTSSISIAGADVTLPMAAVTYFNNCDGVVSSGNIGRPRKDGLYEITADVQLSAGGNVWIMRNSTEIARINGGEGSVSLGVIESCVDGDSITVHGGGGGNATRGRLRLKFEGNGTQ